MSEGYFTVELGPLCKKIGSGVTPRGGDSVYVDSGVSFIRSQNVYNNFFSEGGLAYLSDIHAHQLAGVTVEAGDVLLNITGDSVARVCQVPDRVLPARVNQHVAIIRPDTSKLDAGFLRFFLSSPEMQAHMLSLASSGGTRNALTKSMIERFRVPLPPLPEQRAIAHVLGTLDDKIELNRQMNRTLEEIARTLFKAWFVDFAPVRARAEGRDPGLPAELAALFPASFEDSALGEIPAGWRVKGLLEIADLLSGGTPSTADPDYWDGEIPWVSAKDVTSAQGGYVLSTERTITQSGVRESSTQVLPKNTTIVTARGTVGSICLLGRPMAMNQTNYGLRSKEIVGDLYVNRLVETLIEQLRQQAYGTIFDTITTKTFRDTLIPVPNLEVAQTFERIVTPLFARMLGNAENSRTLAQLRDTLLPRLMSGDIRVPVMESGE